MMMSLDTVQPQLQQVPPGHALSEVAAQRPRISSHSLMKGNKLLLIDHDGMQYTLRVTRAGKLILTK